MTVMDEEVRQDRVVHLPLLRVEHAPKEAAAPVEAAPPPSAPMEPPAPRPLAEGARAAHVNREPREDATIDERSLEARIVEALRHVYDPEIPVNVYDLGLIYDIYLYPEGEVRVLMTLTAPGCPVAGSIVAEVEARVESLPDVKRCNVDLVWQPQWGREMMSEIAQLELGM